MKKLCSLALILTMAFTFIACGTNSENINDNIKESDEAVTETETSIFNLLETQDYDGYKFRILGEEMRDYYFVEEMTGDIVEDSIYERNQTVEQMFNIELDYHIVEWK